MRYIHNRTTHTANKNHTALGLAFHQVAGDGGGEEVGPVDVDGEQLAHAVDGVVGRLEVLGEAGRGHEVVNLAVARQDLVDTGLDALRV